MFVGRASDYAKYLKERNKNVEGISQWEEFFLKPTEEDYQNATKSASQTFDYDISSAFAAYKQSKVTAEMSNVWTGQKAGIGGYLENAYKSMFSKSLNDKYATFDKAGQAYATAMEGENKRLTKLGARYATIERSAYDYIGSVLGEDFDPTNKAMMAKYYNFNSDGSMSLNEEGVDLWDRVLNGSPTTTMENGEVSNSQTFESYLYETDKDAFDFYQENIGDVREMVGGLKPDDFEYSPEERRNRLDANTIENRLDTSNMVGDVTNSFTTQAERLQYLTNLEKKVNASKVYVQSAQISQSDNAYSAVIDGVDYVSDGSGGKPLIYRIPSNNTQIKNYGFTFTTKNNPYTQGDVFSFDGNTYWYMLDNSQAVALVRRG